MAAPLIGAAARMAAKKLAEKTQPIKKAAEDLGDLGKVVAGMLGGFTALGGAETAKYYLQNKKIKERQEQKQYEEQDKQEGRGMKSGGKVSSASKRADGICKKGKTKGRFV